MSEVSSGTASTDLRTCKGSNFHLVKSSDVVLLRPKRDATIFHTSTVERGEKDFFVERHHKVIVVDGHTQRMPAILLNVGFRALNALALAVCEEQQVNPMFQSACAHG